MSFQRELIKKIYEELYPSPIEGIELAWKIPYTLTVSKDIGGFDWSSNRTGVKSHTWKGPQAGLQSAHTNML